jgi:hypothetical protein
MLLLVVFGEIDQILDLQPELAQGEEGEEGRNQHCHIKMRVVCKMERGEVEGEQPLDEKPREVDALNSEETTCEHDDQEGEEYRGKLAQPFVEFLEKELVSADEDALQGAIDDKVPRRSMPETRYEKTEPKVEVFPEFRLHAAASEREVKIVLDEDAEGLVPPAPEFGDGC